jgi:uncharacterized membrane protein
MKTLAITASLLLASTILMGANYGKMSTDELLNLRGTPKTMEERHQLHNELQKRYEHMSQEQKQRFDSRPGNRKGGGMGTGRGMGGGQGMGGGRGR